MSLCVHVCLCGIYVVSMCYLCMCMIPVCIYVWAYTLVHMFMYPWSPRMSSVFIYHSKFYSFGMGPLNELKTCTLARLTDQKVLRTCDQKVLRTRSLSQSVTMLGLYVRAIVPCGLFALYFDNFSSIITILLSIFQLWLFKSQTLIPPFKAFFWYVYVDFILGDWQVLSQSGLLGITCILGLFLFLGLFPNFIMHLQ